MNLRVFDLIYKNELVERIFQHWSVFFFLVNCSFHLIKSQWLNFYIGLDVVSQLSLCWSRENWSSCTWDTIKGKQLFSCLRCIDIRRGLVKTQTAGPACRECDWQGSGWSPHLPLYLGLHLCRCDQNPGCGEQPWGRRKGQTSLSTWEKKTVWHFLFFSF